MYSYIKPFVPPFDGYKPDVVMNECDERLECAAFVFFECLLEVGYWSCYRLESERSIAGLAVYRLVWPS